MSALYHNLNKTFLNTSMNNNDMDHNTPHYRDLATIARLAEGYQQVYGRLIHYSQQQVVYRVTTEDACFALAQVQNGEVEIEALEMWANLLEIRGDIDHSQVEGLLYALANPEQMGTMSHEKVTQLLNLYK
ncbi:hypothetical protein BET10_15945 [Pseudoalteromonas amylolytica]|uniref:Uncharacterized protein n=2 Tax=Pseudoalteromonas TaxID=53246 RepID=A0A1S1MT10_9GAMM|nr:hypothetical protein BFC16_16375 [Pseudoalteromonas sp. JW3]OHU89617.1 hypothetical protein BET10_15945 [Pseudoalteromonas amylolytica]